MGRRRHGKRARPTGDEVHFVTLADGSIVVDEDVPDGCLAPLAEAVEEELRPPYRAEGVRNDDDVWGVGAAGVVVVTLPAAFEGDWIELTCYQGEQRCAVDGNEQRVIPELLAVGERERPDFALRAERIDDTTWVVECEPL